jgi:hypothetical protein
MPRDPFDDLARRVLESGSRRGLLRSLSVALLATLGHQVPATTAAPKRRSACRKAGKPCSPNRRCCAGASCRGGRCRCLPGKKPCAGACIPRGRRCPGPGGGTEPGGCLPGQPCCASGWRSCGHFCAPPGGCCTDAECPGECRFCQFGACMPVHRGTPCGAGSGMACNSQGACAKLCDLEHPCPELPPPTTAAESCREIVCWNGICENRQRSNGFDVPNQFQVPFDCEFLICASVNDGVAPDPDRSLNDVPDDPSECLTWICESVGSEPVLKPQPPDTACDNGNGRCDELGNCVPWP